MKILDEAARRMTRDLSSVSVLVSVSRGVHDSKPTMGIARASAWARVAFGV
jgi:hypothetical protein